MVQRALEAVSPTSPAKMPTQEMPSCMRAPDGSDILDAATDLSVRSAFEGKVVLITGAGCTLRWRVLQQLT